MKVMLKVEAILENMPSEEHLLDVSHIDSIYAIRKLTAAVRAAHYNQSHILGEVNEHGQRYSEIYKIWFDADEFISWE